MVAVISAEGTIGRQATGPRGGSATITPRAVRAQLEAARADPAVRAVVLRVSSPGGDAVASEVLWREVACFVEDSQKPLVVSFGAYGASGAYMLGSAATKIVAQPGTLTGSIGVVAAKLDAAGLLRQQRLTVQEISVGGPTVSPFRSLTPKQRHQVGPTTAAPPRRHQRAASAAGPPPDHALCPRAQLATSAERTYDGFVAKVAAGRSMSTRRVRAFGKGRVWTGKQAHARGLVDALGPLAPAPSERQERGDAPH